MVRLLLDLVSDEEKPRALLEAARNSLDHAREHWDKGEYVEAWKRVWTSVLLGLEAYAYKSGVELGSGLSWYWSISSKASVELGDEALIALYSGLAAFIAAREELGDDAHFGAISARVSAFLDKLGGVLGEER